MLRSSSEIKGYSLKATDGSIGKARDFLFSDFNWVIRYLVADTGGWLSDHKVLVSPISLDKPDYDNQSLPIRLTRDQIKNSPSLETDKPVSRQFEISFHRHFQWPAYWGGALAWGIVAYPKELFLQAQKAAAEDVAEETDGDPHLRSMNEVEQYHIMASDGDIGSVKDFIIEDEDWKVRYLVIDTRKWLPGKKVIISSDWIEELDYTKSMVHVDISREKIRNSPEYDPKAPIVQMYEARLHDYYRRPFNP